MVFDLARSLRLLLLVVLDNFDHFDARVPVGLDLGAGIVMILLVNFYHFLVFYLNVAFPELSNGYQASHQWYEMIKTFSPLFLTIPLADIFSTSYFSSSSWSQLKRSW